MQLDNASHVSAKRYDAPSPAAVEPASLRIDTLKSGALDHDVLAVLIEERFAFALDHSSLLADHVLRQAGGDLVASEVVAEHLWVQSLLGALTSVDLEAATLLLEQLLGPTQTPGGTDPLDAHRQVLAQVPPGTELQDYTPEQIEAYNALHKAYMEEHGEHVLHHHHQWHQDPSNGSGGTEEPGSGAAFLTMHRQMITDFEDFVNQGIPGGSWTVPELDPTRLLPPNLGQPSDIDPNLADRLSNDPNTTRPDFLTEGGNAQPPFPLDGKDYHGLEDFESLDDLGRALSC